MRPQQEWGGGVKEDKTVHRGSDSHRDLVQPGSPGGLHTQPEPLFVKLFCWIPLST